MTRTWQLTAMVVTVTAGLAACGSPPAQEIDAARTSMERANTAQASQYAAESHAAAQRAREALDAEIKAQEGAWMKSHDRTRELAVAARTAADKAVTDAETERARVETEARATKEKAAAAERRRAQLARVTPGGPTRAPIKVKNVQPVYPAMARQARVQGDVVLEVELGTDGYVKDARVVKSVPLLDQAAIDAVKQWQYTPATKGGVAVPVIMNVTISFTRP